MSSKKEEVLETKIHRFSESVSELTRVKSPTERKYGLEPGLNEILVTKEMFSLGRFSLEKKEFEGRSMAVVKTTDESLQKFNGAWIFRINDSIVSLCDYFEVQKNIKYDMDNWEKATVSVYFSERPQSYFENAPRQVGVSIKVINMSEIDTMKQTFEARFIMKIIWEPSFEEIQFFTKKGYHTTGSGWRPRFIFPNCVEVKIRRRFKWPLRAKEGSNHQEPFILSKYIMLKHGDIGPYGSVISILPNYIMYGELEFHGVFAELLELKAFPFDCQDFSIICWSNTILEKQQIIPFDLFFGAWKNDNLVYEGLGKLGLLTVNLSSSNVTSEWNIKNAHVSIEKGYRSDMYRSNMYIILKGRRVFRLYLWRIFIPVFLLVLGSTVSFLLSPTYGGDRVTLVFTAVLANVVYQLAVYGELPQIPYMTYLDWYNLTYFILMLLILLINALIVFHSEQYFEDHFHNVDEDHLRRIDLTLGLMLVLLQFICLAVFTIWGYKIYVRQNLKLTLTWEEQVEARIISKHEVDYRLDSNERKHQTSTRNGKKRSAAYDSKKDYMARLEL